MEVIFIAQLILLIWAKLAIGQQCTDQDWSSTFAVDRESMSQCSTKVSYVNGLVSQGYGVNFNYGPGVIEKARCCDINLPYSQEDRDPDCYEEQWWYSLLVG